MSRGKIIPFETREQILQRAQAYMDSIELFVEERRQAVPVLIKAMKHADRRARHEIMLLLGTFAKQEAAGPVGAFRV